MKKKLIIFSAISLVLIATIVALLLFFPRQEPIVVAVGDIEISESELSLSMLERSVMNAEQIEVENAAYRIVAYRMAEEALIGTMYEFTSDDRATIIRNVTESFGIDEERNLELVASLGITRDELIEIVILASINGEIAARHVSFVFDDLAIWYEQRHGVPLELDGRIIEIHDEFMLEKVSSLSYSELNPSALQSIVERANAVHDHAIEVHENFF